MFTIAPHHTMVAEDEDGWSQRMGMGAVLQ